MPGKPNPVTDAVANGVSLVLKQQGRSSKPEDLVPGVTGKDITVDGGKLTDDDFDVVAGQRDQLAGKIQERYEIAKEEAEMQVAEWQSKASDSWSQRARHDQGQKKGVRRPWPTPS